MLLAYINCRIDWGSARTEHPFALILEIPTVCRRGACYGGRRGSHWRYLPARRTRPRNGHLLRCEGSIQCFSQQSVDLICSDIAFGATLFTAYWRYVVSISVCLNNLISFFIRGTVSYYFSWRVMQGSIGIVGLIAFIAMFFFFPETSQPGARGIDKLKAEEGDRYRKRFIFVNPLRPMLLLRSPNLFLIVRFFLEHSFSGILIFSTQCMATSASLMAAFGLSL